MEEIQLIDDALDGCYSLQNRIATLLAKIGEITAEKNTNYQIVNLREKKSKSSSLSSSSSSSKKINPKDRKKTGIEYAKFVNKETGPAGDDENKTKIFETPIKGVEMIIESETSNIFTKLSESFVEENADDYLKSYKKKIEQRLMAEKMELNFDDESIDILANLNDIIVQVNAESTQRKRKQKKSRWTMKNPNFKEKKSQNASKIEQKNEMEKMFSIKGDDMELENSSIAFDARSDDSGYCSGFRSLNEIKSTYAKIDKKFIEVKRSVQSVEVRMKHVGEIINRQKGVFHVTVQCGGGESFVCQH